MLCISLCSMMMFREWYWSLACGLFALLQQRVLRSVFSLGLGLLLAYGLLFEQERAKVYLHTLKASYSAAHWKEFLKEVREDFGELCAPIWESIQRTERYQKLARVLAKGEGESERKNAATRPNNLTHAAANTALKRVWSDGSTNEDWTVVSMNEGVLLKTKKVKDRVIAKTYASLECSPEEVAEILKDWQQMPSWNPTFAEASVLSVLDEHTSVTHGVTGPIRLKALKLDSRDFVTLRKWSKQPSGCYVFARISMNSFEHEPSKGVIRGVAGVCGAVVFTPKLWDGLAILATSGNPSHCGVSFILDYDLRVTIPRSVVDGLVEKWATTTTSSLVAYVRARNAERVEEGSSSDEGGL